VYSKFIFFIFKDSSHLFVDYPDFKNIPSTNLVLYNPIYVLS